MRKTVLAARRRLTAQAPTRLAARLRRDFTWERVYARHLAPLLESVAGAQDVRP